MSADRASPGTVHDATHDRDLDRQVQALERALRGVGHRDHVDLGASARRARDEVEASALPQAHRLEQHAAGLRLLDRIGRERVADRVADALREQRRDAGRGLHEPLRDRTGLGDAEVERMVGDVGQLAVGLDHHGDVRRLDRDLDEVVADLLEVADLLLGRLDHRRGRRSAEALVELGVERAGVDADAARDAAITRLGRDELDVLGLADVAGVQPQLMHPRIERRQGELVLEVDVGDDRQR